MVALPAPLIARILMLAPLVIVPRLLRWPGWPALLAALPLVIAFALPPGPIAAVLTGPWIVLSFAALAATVREALPRLRVLLTLDRTPDLGNAAATGFLAVGATFLTTDRLGLQPLGFAPVIILLTAVHFHFAGFGLLTIASRLARRLAWITLPVVGLILGIPITALGFVLDSLWIGAVGAVIVGGSGLVVGLGLLAALPAPSLDRVAWRLAGLALLIAMPLGIGWSVALLVGASLMPLDLMVRTHGVLNALAVTLVALRDRGLPR
jgi:hypothetical protein